MADAKEIKKAKEVFGALIKMLDGRNWTYEKDEENFIVKSGVKGDDLPIEFILVVHPEKQVVQLLSWLTAELPEDKRLDGALAVCVANNGLCDGSFDYDLSDGKIMWRLTTSYRGSTVTPELFEYIIAVSASTIDQYNDRFFMLAKNMMTLQQFLEKENS